MNKGKTVWTVVVTDGKVYLDTIAFSSREKAETFSLSEYEKNPHIENLQIEIQKHEI